ncbi:hypothetical protein MKW98_001715 [Papaver atlanticum]|uniref:MIF4G domain-containing protein n=1 Tax=Papaver atlanticum TaxID=357466 RepID=A0AAD4S8I8_9MAGN|nr:hypothetical protein MKW98_001715 [Papaver atlanticum]
MADNSSIPEVGEGPVPPPCLMKAEVSWMSTVRGNLSYEERILRRVRGILNKLTVEKYTLLRNQLIDSGITTPSILHGVASLILNKALAEPMFCPLYAFLCSKLCVYGQLPSFPLDEHGGEEITFRRILLNECQQVFEHENVKVAEIRQQIVTGSLSRDLGWRRNLGFIKFVCELSKKKIMPLKITLFIVMQLMQHDDVEINVEAVCLLLNTTGKKLDQLGAMVPKKIELNDESPNLYHTCHEACVDWLKDVLTTHPQLETRMKFMIHNLLDLRANNWVELRHNKVKDKMISELISASDAEALSRLHPGASTSTNTRTHRAVQFRPLNRPDPHCW